MNKEDIRMITVIVFLGIAALMACVTFSEDTGVDSSAIEGNSGNTSGIKLLSVASCSVDEGYEYCYSNYNLYHDARAYAEIQGTPLQGESGIGIIEGREVTYYLDEVYVNVKHTGDRLTAVRGATSWDSCSNIGCGGSNVPDGQYVIATAPAKNPPTVYFAAWDKDTDDDGYWSWTAVYWGWVLERSYYDLYVIDCYDDADCEYGEFCDNSGSWDTWSCAVDMCAYMDEAEPECEGFDLYSIDCYHGEYVTGELIEENSRYCGYVCEEGATKSYFCGDDTKVTKEVCESNEWITVDDNPGLSCPVSFWNVWDILDGYFKELFG